MLSKLSVDWILQKGNLVCAIYQFNWNIIPISSNLSSSILCTDWPLLLNVPWRRKVSNLTGISASNWTWTKRGWSGSTLSELGGGIQCELLHCDKWILFCDVRSPPKRQNNHCKRNGIPLFQWKSLPFEVKTCIIIYQDIKLVDWWSQRRLKSFFTLLFPV